MVCITCSPFVHVNQIDKNLMQKHTDCANLLLFQSQVFIDRTFLDHAIKPRVKYLRTCYTDFIRTDRIPSSRYFTISHIRLWFAVGECRHLQNAHSCSSSRTSIYSCVARRRSTGIPAASIKQTSLSFGKFYPSCLPRLSPPRINKHWLINDKHTQRRDANKHTRAYPQN